MNIKKISIGLLFLILALVIVPGATARPSYAPALGGNTLHQAAAAPGCAGGCHNMPVFCAGCHDDPYATPAPVPVLTTITVTPSTANVLISGTHAFTATPKDQNGNPIVATITWASSNTVVGTISATGVLTGVSAGNTTVTASSGSVNGTAAVTVQASTPAPVLTTITVTPSTATVLISAPQDFTSTQKDQFGNPIAANITWTSSNTTVGTINTTGTFTALAAGTTNITAASGSVSRSAVVTVPALLSLPVLTTITVTPSTANVLVGGTQAFKAAPKDQNGNPIVANITWTSSNTTVGTIDTSGKFTAVAAGTTTITAASRTLNGTVSGTATMTVTATTPGDNEHHYKHNKHNKHSDLDHDKHRDGNRDEHSDEHS